MAVITENPCANCPYLRLLDAARSGIASSHGVAIPFRTALDEQVSAAAHQTSRDLDCSGPTIKTLHARRTILRRLLRKPVVESYPVCSIAPQIAAAVAAVRKRSRS